MKQIVKILAVLFMLPFIMIMLLMLVAVSSAFLLAAI